MAMRTIDSPTAYPEVVHCKLCRLYKGPAFAIWLTRWPSSIPDNSVLSFLKSSVRGGSILSSPTLYAHIWIHVFHDLQVPTAYRFFGWMLMSAFRTR